MIECNVKFDSSIFLANNLQMSNFQCTKFLSVVFTSTINVSRLITRRFEDILSSLSSERKNSVMKVKGANIQYVNLHEQFCP